MKNHRIRANGITINVNEYTEKGTPLVFLHYLNGTIDIWNQVIPKFTSDYHVIAVDLRGHGGSDQPNGDYRIQSVAKDVVEVMDALELASAHFIGSSFGGDVATYLASQWPERVLSLVNSEGALVNHSGSGGLYDESKEQHIADSFLDPEPEFESREAFLQYMKENWVPWNNVKEAALKNYEPRRLENGKRSFITKQTTIKEIVADLYDVRLQDWYKTVQCPVLFLPSEKDEGLDKKLAFIKEIEPMLPFTKTVVIPETEHSMMFDHHAEMTDEIKSFYLEISKAEARLVLDKYERESVPIEKSTD